MAGAGALSLLGACALLAWQYATRLQTGAWVGLPIASYLPDVPAGWIGQYPALSWILEKIHVGAPFGVIGAVLLVMGVLMVLRQNEILRMQERAAADRLRRVRLGQYGDPDRREPYIGPSIPEIPERHRKAA